MKDMTNMKEKALLSLRHITKQFAEGGRVQTVLDDVSFSVGYGETVGIVGRSGSGKTTIARAAARFIDVSSGQIIFDGEDITKLKGKRLQNAYDKMQMVFQLPASSFDPRRTLGFSISERFKNAGMAKSQCRLKTAEILSLCGLSPEMAERYPHEASGGQCQRAAIARALAAEPKLLICDEATSALDIVSQAQIISLLRDLKHRYGMAVLFICHNLAVAQSFCDRVIVMHDGKIAESGTADEVINNPQSEYTKQLIEAVL